MAKLVESVAVRAPVKRVFEVLSDFESYPRMFKEIVGAKIVRRTKLGAEVAFEADIVSRIGYTLKMKLAPPHRITWSLVKGDFMEANDGAWELTELEPNLTDASFSVEIKFPFWVPESMASSALKSNLPSMLASVKKEAERAGSRPNRRRRPGARR